ncbi:Hypothetical predicted protein, partial [Paramuricea clavata]
DLGIEKTVTEIWYSILLSQATYECLRTSLEELTSFMSAQNLQLKTAGLISVDEMQFKQLQDAWKTWLGLRVQGTKWIQKQREDVTNSNIEFVARNSGYIENVPVEHVSAVKKWIDDCVFKRTQAPRFAENPTFTGVDVAARNAHYSYCIPPGLFPFSSWDYLQVKKFKDSNCLVTMYGDYIECILRRLMKILSKQQVSFRIVLCDCMDIKQYLEVNTVYDRILTSNLMDYVFLPNLLKLCSQIINQDNHHTTIITETILWARDIMPEGDIPWPSNKSQLPKFEKIAFEDTKRSSFAMDGGTSFREYLDNSCDFFNYLRAMFYAYRLKRVGESGSTHDKPTIPVIKELGNEFQLRLRDGIRNENRIVFFRPAINRRRVTIVSGMERYLEWIPIQKK